MTSCTYIYIYIYIYIYHSCKRETESEHVCSSEWWFIFRAGTKTCCFKLLVKRKLLKVSNSYAKISPEACYSHAIHCRFVISTWGRICLANMTHTFLKVQIFTVVSKWIWAHKSCMHTSIKCFKKIYLDSFYRHTTGLPINRSCQLPTYSIHLNK